jgi:D-serine deaminase-like pyridoxal phosphate-dependent protein
VAEQERTAAVKAAQILRESGMDCPEVSTGSTPTACFGETFEGVTEVRAGVYLFGDLFQSALGTCERSSLAVSVLATVISRNPVKHTLVVDAGGLALSKDRSRLVGGPDTGYGLVAALDGNLLTPDTAVFDVHQEHGEVRIDASPHLTELQVGSRMRIYPNHACMTAAMYDRYHVVRGSGIDVIDIWDKTQGW